MRQFRAGWFPVFAVALALCLCPPGCGSSSKSDRPGQPAAREVPQRGLFVTRWDFRSVDDIRRIAGQARAAGFTDLYWQVRGQADAFYASDLEPWGQEIAGNGDGPGFDPLEEAIRAASDQNLRVHAWMNTLALWHGGAPPAEASHLRRAHPEWLLIGADGKPMRSRDGYELVNPLLPEVRVHLEAVASDLASRYELDGLCFDVLRFPVGGELLPGDAASRRRFAMENADALGAGAERSVLAREWMVKQMTLVAAGLARSGRDARPGLSISFVSVGLNPQGAVAQGQYAAGWAQAGIADRVVVLIAAGERGGLVDAQAAWTRGLGKAQDRLVPTLVPAAQGDPGVFKEQLAALGRGSALAVFSYSALFETVDAAVPHDAVAVARRAARVQAFRAFAGNPAKPAKDASPLLSEIKGEATDVLPDGADGQERSGKSGGAKNPSETDGAKPIPGDAPEPSHEESHELKPTDGPDADEPVDGPEPEAGSKPGAPPSDSDPEAKELAAGVRP